MKAVFTILFFSLMTLAAFAQDDELPQPQDQKVRDKIEAARIAYITDQLELTPAEAEKFWPIYREFAEKRREIRQQLRQTRKANPNQSDEELVNQQFKAKQQELDLEKDYSGRLIKVISAQKLRSLPQAEKNF